ncbi:heterokaryon incompatibility protein-domain-containing protein [Apodospora peruviana]|uniref:Heterokaryon incompatibility protein-domain-containing protein n=1 Tax=Apodospora peruviana TaxID=516989 RepID=A0AAE0LY62_9PEZI|nr:heterokaryon incompatibility protein-domain-containing protein [Apodospora peruviana]
MRHQLKEIHIRNIQEQHDIAIFDKVMRNHDSEPINDPDVLSMRQDYDDVKDFNRDLPKPDEPKRTRDKDGMTDDDRDRVRVWMQTNSPDNSEYRHHQFVKRWGLLHESKAEKNEEWFIESPPVLDESDPEYLCDMCRQIDFSILFSQRGLPGNHKPGPTVIQVYGIPKLMKEVDCSFCSLLRRGLEAECSPEDLEKSVAGPEIKTFKIAVLDEGPKHAQRLEIEFGDLNDTAIPRLIVQKMVAAPDSGPLAFEGLLVRQNVADVQRLRDWLRCCEEDHPTQKQTPHQWSDQKTLRVIDTVDNCVKSVEMPCRYACLSYVWGKGTQAQLTASTKTILESPGGLLETSLGLNQTIKDAIQVSRDVGLRYIWIDALCIIQDDLEDKMAIISNMSFIYGNAVLTIVAATNSDPAQGLPGVKLPRSRAQITEKLQGMELAIAFHDQRRPYDEIETSVWNSRAWTFQERHLSQRSVYFTFWQMCFTCPHGTAYEDTVPVQDLAGYKPLPLNNQTRLTSNLHELQMTVFGDETQAQYPNKAMLAKGQSSVIWMAEDPNNPKEIHPEGIIPIYEFEPVPDSAGARTGTLLLKGETLWRAYANAVSMYTKRQMTWQSDALNAFTGVGDLVAQGVNTTFWFGLPEFAFDQALLWYPQTQLVRRDLNIPTWSWAAWQGHSSYRGRGWHNAITFPSFNCVKWLRRIDKQTMIERYLAPGNRTPQEIEAFNQRLGTQLLLSELNPDDLFHLANFNRSGWELESDDKDRNEHIYVHRTAYPGLRFSYPISLPNEPLLERPDPKDGTLFFSARSVYARFYDISSSETFSANEFIVPGRLEHEYLQIGLNSNSETTPREIHRSATRLRPWQHVIYHQGYRAGFLYLNVPDSEIDLSDHENYELVAVSRDSIPHIAPPAQGWDVYWKSHPAMMQDHIYFREEWGDAESLVAMPEIDFSKGPETYTVSENGDPKWDEGRFGPVTWLDVYNVLLVRRKETGRVLAERIGVGKVSVNAFRYAKPGDAGVVGLV